MKKITVALLLSLLLITPLCACQKQVSDTDSNSDQTQVTPKGDDETEKEPSFTVKDIADDLSKNAAFPVMYVMTDEEIERQFDFSADLFSELYASAADQYPGIERSFIGKLKDGENKQTVIDSLNQYLETLKAEYIDYVPSEYDKAKNVSVYDKDDYVCLVIAEDSAEALKIVKNYIK